MNFAYDRKAYSDQVNGEEGALKSIRNLLCPTTFVQVGDKNFGDVVKKMLSNTAMSGKMLISQMRLTVSTIQRSQSGIRQSKEALQAEGVEFPIHLDIPTIQTNTLIVKTGSNL